MITCHYRAAGDALGAIPSATLNSITPTSANCGHQKLLTPPGVCL